MNKIIVEKALGTLYDLKELNVIKKIVNSQKPLTYGKEISDFEKQFAKYIGAKFAVAVSSCGAALNIASKLLNLSKGDNVICQANAFWVTIVSLLERGVKIKTVDVEFNTLNIDPNKIEKKIDKKTKAIFIVHHGGNPANLSLINSISQKYSIPIVEDCAHVLGSEINTKKIGHNSYIACFSFAQHKNISTLGEGGMIVTNSKKFYEQSKGLRTNFPIGKKIKRKVKNLGKNFKPESPGFMHAGDAWDYDWVKVNEFGSAYRMSSLQAAVGSIQLKKLKNLNRLREKIANKYSKFISNSNIFTSIKVNPTAKHSWYLYDFFLNVENCKVSRDKIISELLDNYKIKLKLRYWPIHLGAIMRMRGGKPGQCPVFEDIWFNKLLSLPIAPSMTDKEVERILNALNIIDDKYKIFNKN